MCVYQLDSPERAVILRFGEYHEETGEGLNFMIAGVDEKYVENVALTRRYSQTANMLTKDENLVDVTVSVQYRIKNLKDFQVAGKSGTAELVSLDSKEAYLEVRDTELLRDHSIIIAFGPMPNPQYAVSVVIENGESGGAVAGPVAIEVLKSLLNE